MERTGKPSVFVAGVVLGVLLGVLQSGYALAGGLVGNRPWFWVVTQLAGGAIMLWSLWGPRALAWIGLLAISLPMLLGGVRVFASPGGLLALLLLVLSAVFLTVAWKRGADRATSATPSKAHSSNIPIALAWLAIIIVLAVAILGGKRMAFSGPGTFVVACVVVVSIVLGSWLARRRYGRNAALVAFGAGIAVTMVPVAAGFVWIAVGPAPECTWICFSKQEWYVIWALQGLSTAVVVGLLSAAAATGWNWFRRRPSP